MAKLRANILANFAGLLWNALLSLLLVPVYIRLLGVESYGLVGFFITLQDLLRIFDLGLGTTVTREIARRMRAADPEAGSFVRTFEAVYWGMSLLFAGGLFALAGPIAHRWVKVQQLSPETVQQAIWIFGLVFAARWPSALYGGVLRGLERQVLNNAITIGVATMRHVLTIGALLFVSRSITAFLLCQLAAALLEVGALSRFSWIALRKLHLAATTAFQGAVLRKTWRFAADVSALSVLGLITAQVDKMYISRQLPLEKLGYYAVASALSAVVNLFAGAIFTAILPRFAALADDESALAQEYHRASRWLAFLVAPVAAALALFAHQLLLLWTHSETIAGEAGTALMFLALGQAFASFVGIPFQLELAAGLTKIPLRLGVIAFLFMVPTSLFLTMKWGIAGSGASWAVLNAFHIVAHPIVLHRHILRGQLRAFFFGDMIPFALLALFAFGSARVVLWLLHLSAPWAIPLGVLGGLAYLGLSYLFYGAMIRTELGRLMGRFRARSGAGAKE